MGCPNRHLSYSSWRLQVFRRIFLPIPELRHPIYVSRRSFSSENHPRNEPQHQDQQPSCDEHNGAVGNSSNEESPTDASSESEGGAPRPSQLLPQSPLLTKPRAQLEKKRKRPASKEDLDRLRRNPWAVALASPPRLCIASGTRLPRAFLTEYGMVRPHEESESLWLMPVGLLKDELKAAAKKTEEPAAEADSEDKARPANSKSKSNPLRIATVRILDRILLLKEATKLFLIDRFSRRKKSAVTQIIPFRWRYPNGPLTSSTEKNLVWREDMPDFVLKNMRKEVVKELEKVCRQSKNLNTADGVWRAFGLRGNSEAALIEGLRGMQELENMEWGGVLIMGPDSGEKKAQSSVSGKLAKEDMESIQPTSFDPPLGAEDSVASLSPSRDVHRATLEINEEVDEGSVTFSDPALFTENPVSEPQAPMPELQTQSGPFVSPFPDYITLPQRGTKVPVFDLSVILSEDDRRALRNRHPRFREDALFFRPGGITTVDPMLALWRLKGYVMYDTQYLEDDGTSDA